MIRAKQVGPIDAPTLETYLARSWGNGMPVNFEQAPILLFWETTRACKLA